MRLPSLTALALLVPLVAVAQTTGTEPIQIQVNQSERQIVNRDGCGSQFTFTWQIAQSAACGAFQVWLTEASSCPDDPPEGTEFIFTQSSSGGVFTQNSGTFTRNVSQLPAFKETACGTTDLDVEYRVCGRFKTPSFSGSCSGEGTGVVVEPTPPTIGFDSVRPGAPTLSEAVGLDQSIAVSFSAATGTEVVIATARDPAGKVKTVEAAKPATRVTITGLENFVEYTVTAEARDAAGNVSPASNELKATPILT
ncbi:MAG: MXAN_2561 family MXYO-CTERM-anchored protein, partial [Myxococcaceae bacterium]